jgi:hypothetical protein
MAIAEFNKTQRMKDQHARSILEFTDGEGRWWWWWWAGLIAQPQALPLER